MPSNYDQVRRDPKIVKFYNSAEWKRVRDAKRAETPWCEYVAPGRTEPCGNPVEQIHHLKKIETAAGWEARLDPAGLRSVCNHCHKRWESEIPDAPYVSGTLKLVEDDEYYFDAEAGDKPIRFIERFCTHYEGRFKGKPFILHPVQRRIVSDVYGWKSRATGFRRFNQVYFEAAVGAGKSPLLAALGLYGLIADGEAAAQVFALSRDYSTAKVIFDCAKAFIDQSPALSGCLESMQFEIRHPKSRSVWKIISGKGPKAGFRPSLCLGDECMEWPSRVAYNSIQSRMPKRDQPLFWIATNSGTDRNSLCWELHEEAAGVLLGTRTNPGLYPIIWAAPLDAKPDDPKSWEAANQLMGVTIAVDKVAAKWEVAKESPAEEDEFRRLYLSQWVQGSKKWLQIDQWDANCGPIAPEAIAGLPCYVGLDLSECDDLSAAVYVWVAPDRFYVDADFWVPAVTAAKYERKDGVPYSKWAKAGQIDLVEELTISAEVRRRISARVVERTAGHTVEKVCYDRAKADDCIARLAAAGMKCDPIAQGWTVSPGCNELARRLTEKSLLIAPNAVLRAHAEVVEIKFDDRGNYWPVKPNAKNRYAGKRSAKIDGISAFVTVLTEARKHNFPAASQRWNGSVGVISLPNCI